MSDSLANNIRHYRKQLGLTQAQLANFAGISLMSIRRYETIGEDNREPSIENLKKIADALKVETWVLTLPYQTRTPIQETDQRAAFLNYLEKLGYEYVDGSWYDAPLNEVGMIQIKRDNTELPLSHDEFELLERSIENNIELEIYRLRKEKNI